MVVSTPPSSAALDVLADATILEVAISALEKAGTKEVGKLNRNKGLGGCRKKAHTHNSSLLDGHLIHASVIRQQLMNDLTLVSWLNHA
eukprot:1145625-Pelagomonas_calceolata.AAC.13